MEFIYPALKVKQTGSDKILAMFSAPCMEIQMWAGVPQKKSFGGAETTGFQRELSEKRLKSLLAFFSNEDNIIQNPLICASRDTSLGEVSADFGDGDIGKITIKLNEYDKIQLRNVIQMVRKGIELRVPSLVGKKPSDDILGRLKASCSEDYDTDKFIEINIDSVDEDIESVLFEETHIIDFWNELYARELLIEELNNQEDEFLGFDKCSLVQFLLPISLVDGQHRLEGSLLALDDKLKSAEVKKRIEEMIIAGVDNEEVVNQLKVEYARKLPISIMLDPSPEEQVFQFVMINQKATPLPKPLLSTIISTTLSKEEMENVNVRLQQAGLELTDAQSVTWAARSPESAFSGLVERGFSCASNSLLKWSVMGSIVAIMRDLKGSELWGVESDFAKRWRDSLLEKSTVVDNYAEKGFSTKYEYWRDLNGPWKQFFLVFWNEIKERFSSDDDEKFNYWGKPRQSNLFNKISLTILISDFMKYMVTARTTINNFEDIPSMMDDWLLDVKVNYFDRDWKTFGIKKDSPGIRKQWASIWIKYRENPTQLPTISSYRIAKKD